MHLKDDSGMLYRLNKRRENKTYYICVEKKALNCPATAIVENKTQLIKLVEEHVHDSNLMKHKVRKLEDDAIKSSAQNRTVPRTVFGNISTNVVETTKGNILFFIVHRNKAKIC